MKYEKNLNFLECLKKNLKLLGSTEQKPGGNLRKNEKKIKQNKIDKT